MRAKSFTSLLVLGSAVALAYLARRNRGEPARRAVPAGATPAAPDPTALDAEGERFVETFVETMAAWDLGPRAELDVDVTDLTFDAADDLTSGAPAGSRIEPHPYPAASLDEDQPPGESARADIYGDRAALGDGDLYGIHVPVAIDRELPDDDRAFEEGESWLEHLEASAAENGAEPGRPLDMRDESDRPRRRGRAAKTDIPVADRGSGGPRGL
jgi:hypothetical protein